MKRLLVSLAAVGLLAAACKPAEESICTNNDSNCDGVPDDLGLAYDKDDVGGPDPYDWDGDGTVDGYAVDTDCDGQPDTVGLDTNNDGYVDAIDLNPGGEPNVVKTGDSRVSFSCETGLVVTGQGGGVGTGGTTSGDGDGAGTGGVPAGDGDGGGVNPWEEIPDLETGAWHAPIVGAAESNIAIEFTRWKNQNLNDCGGGKLSVPNDEGKLFSEGMGYGLLIMASAGSQAEFDGLYATYRDAPKTSGGLMQWSCNTCGTSCPDSNGNAASDGDLDAAMALLQAEVRWPGSGYVELAKDLIGKLRSSVMKNCAGTVHLVPGEWDPGCQNLNPSYYSPGYYRAFARIDSLGAGVWNQAIDSAYTHWTQTKDTGGNTIWPDGIPGGTCFSCNGFDACRVPWRIAIDYAWTGEPRAATLLQQVAGQVDASGMNALFWGTSGTNSAFYGALALSGLAVSQAKADQFYTDWNNQNPLYDNSYYQSTLRMIYILLAAGRFPSTLPTE